MVIHAVPAKYWSEKTVTRILIVETFRRPEIYNYDMGEWDCFEVVIQDIRCKSPKNGEFAEIT